MSDKPFDQLIPVEQEIRRAFGDPMFDGTLLTIRFISGFELFNTRPHHNHETWAQGWEVDGAGVIVRSEDLDDAVRLWRIRKEKQDVKAKDR